MKKSFIGVLAAISIIAYSCGDNASTTQKEEHASEAHAATEENAEVKVVKASFTNVDAAVAGHIKKLTDNYLLIKNALTNAKPAEAGDAANKITAAIKGFDKSLLSADQKKVYDQQEENLKTTAEHIAKSTGDLEHQREQFSIMSESLYTMVKAFGGGKTLYHDHCPMAKDGKGAMWLSETKAIRNPYFGDKMMECGSVEEEIQ
ncbi:DUF3347 domain-containing protein [Niastella populi]|uniref:DUF3347 domain-containing protein n=1 Tax=Niastella populi TaxID=550983 RepID=A0A1V9EHR5_9BACT|nr:DUF3347 domain-containing protein [Niastella populi]OQP45677.1 hypothetical protein A4R26_09265 [Niastella populi]